MQPLIFPLLSTAILCARTTSATFITLESAANCGGNLIADFNLQPNHSECFQQQNGEPSLYISTNDFPCTVGLWTSTDETCTGSLTAEFYNAENVGACLGFVEFGQDAYIACGVSA